MSIGEIQTIVDQPQFRIDVVELGPMENLIYLIMDKATKRSAVVDPAWDTHKIKVMAELQQSKISDILLTHSHHDHINGIQAILQSQDAQLHLLKAEADFWQDANITPTLYYGGDYIQLGKTTIEIFHTPGHTPGSACYKIGHYLITGDTLFIWGCGHCKLAGSDPEVLFDTLTKLKKFPKQWITLPGHHYATQKTATMEAQCQGNPFLHFDKKSDFIHYRMEVHDRIRTYPYQPE